LRKIDEIERNKIYLPDNLSSLSFKLNMWDFSRRESVDLVGLKVTCTTGKKNMRNIYFDMTKLTWLGQFLLLIKKSKNKIRKEKTRDHN